MMFIKKSRRLVVLGSLVVALGSAMGTAVVHAQQIDEVVLIVDDIAVTQHEYSVLHFIQTQAPSFESTAPDANSAVTKAIVDNLLLAAHAKRLDSEALISDAQIDETIATIASRSGINVDQLLDQLRAQGVDILIFKSSLGQRLLVQNIVAQRIARSVNVSPSEISEYIDNRPELRGQAQIRFRASHMVISIAEGLSKREIKSLRKTADEVRARLEAGEIFGAVAAEYEVVSASGNKGDLGWKKQEELPELFVSALEDLRIGQVSQVLESSNGFHLLVLTDKASSDTVPQEYRVRHIAKALAPAADGRELEAQLRNMKLQILAGLDFAAIARTQSDDAGSRERGGDLGWLKPQEIDPAFAQALRSLKPGEMSEPVRSQFGLHIIQLMQSRAVPGANTMETQVQQLIFSEKVEEKMEDLLNDLKQVSLVEVVAS